MTLGNCLTGSLFAEQGCECSLLPLCICDMRVSRIFFAAEKEENFFLDLYHSMTELFGRRYFDFFFHFLG